MKIYKKIKRRKHKINPTRKTKMKLTLSKTIEVNMKIYKLREKLNRLRNNYIKEE